MDEHIELQRLSPVDVGLFQDLNTVFGEAFGEPETYAAAPPSTAWLKELLGLEHVIALVARGAAGVVGGLVAYELAKFERARREIYIYDLAVTEAYRRRGIATALIERLKEIASERGAWVIFVQADYGDEPAIALYEKLGEREQVLHYDIPVPTRDDRLAGSEGSAAAPKDRRDAG